MLKLESEGRVLSAEWLKFIFTLILNLIILATGSSTFLTKDWCSLFFSKHMFLSGQKLFNNSKFCYIFAWKSSTCVFTWRSAKDSFSFPDRIALWRGEITHRQCLIPNLKAKTCGSNYHMCFINCHIYFSDLGAKFIGWWERLKYNPLKKSPKPTHTDLSFFFLQVHALCQESHFWDSLSMSLLSI